MRGMLMSVAHVSFNTGIFMVFALGAIMPWRQVALICTSFPIMCLIAVFFVRIIISFNRNLSNFIMKHQYFRFQNLHRGYWPKIAQKMQRNHCNGFVDGSPLKPFTTNSQNFKRSTAFQMRASLVPSNRSNVITQNPHFWIKCSSSSERER